MNAPLNIGLLAGSKIPGIREAQTQGSGFACLGMIARTYGVRVDAGASRFPVKVTDRASLESLTAVADAFGFTCRVLKLPLKSLAGLQMPAIIELDGEQFAVLERVKRKRALLRDPAGASEWCEVDDLSKHFTGFALEVRPAKEFGSPEPPPRLKLVQLWAGIAGFKRSIAQTLVLSLVMQVFVLASPYYMQVAVDSALPALDSNLLGVLALGFGLFTLVNAGAALLRLVVLLSAGSRLGFDVATNVARCLFRLPLSWFSARHVGDILSRFQSVGPIQQALTQGAVGALIDGVLALLILGVMFFYSGQLTLVALTAFGLYAIVRIVSFSLQRSLQQDVIGATAKEQTAIVESIRGMVTLRTTCSESARHSLWQSRLADSVNANIRLSRVTIGQTVANTLIFGLENVVTIWLAIGSVISGGFSVGMVFAFIAYKSQFTQRATSLIDQCIAFKMLGLHLERLSDIALAAQDLSFTEAIGAQRELEGTIELVDVRFRYAPAEPYVLNGVSLKIEAGEHVAVTGPSGGGKSTLVKIVLGLLEPESGEVLIDGVPLKRFGYANYRRQVGAVLQEDHLFAGSIAENISMFEDQPNMAAVTDAARAAAVHEEIASMPMGYGTLVGDMGSSLSGGQKQRVLIARALYREPRLIVMDEGTSHLDSANESTINATMAAMARTALVVAHRLETINAADRVIVLRDGQLELKHS